MPPTEGYNYPIFFYVFRPSAPFEIFAELRNKVLESYSFVIDIFHFKYCFVEIQLMFHNFHQPIQFYKSEKCDEWNYLGDAT